MVVDVSRTILQLMAVLLEGIKFGEVFFGEGQAALRYLAEASAEEDLTNPEVAVVADIECRAWAVFLTVRVSAPTTS